jgi:hypothetical protein
MIIKSCLALAALPANSSFKAKLFRHSATLTIRNAFVALVVGKFKPILNLNDLIEFNLIGLFMQTTAVLNLSARTIERHFRPAKRSHSPAKSAFAAIA